MPARTTLSRERALRRLHAEILRCTRCPLHRTRTQAVPGAGSAQARILFVGEAPGRQEDLQGVPFVGAAGKFLDELLASVGLSREQIYITNVVKSRPYVGPAPGRNRAPTADEIEACAPWLDEQLAMLCPAVVVTLGQIALDHLLPGQKLAQVHGRPIQHASLVVLPLYHPAMSRYGHQWKARLRREFQQIPPLLKAAGIRALKEPRRRQRMPGAKIDPA